VHRLFKGLYETGEKSEPRYVATVDSSNLETGELEETYTYPYECLSANNYKKQDSDSSTQIIRASMPGISNVPFVMLDLLEGRLFNRPETTKVEEVALTR
jgi:hypothetical protein